MNKNIIFEFDDTIFEPSQFARGFNKSYDKYRRKSLPSFLKICKHIIAENSYLAEYTLRYNKNVSIITAPIDVEEFFPKRKNRGKIVILGWIGSAFTTNQLRLLVPALEKISQKYPHVILKLIGADDTITFQNIRIQQVSWSLNTMIEELQSFDIGLMPLDEDLFNKGRLGYKMIQYMSMGIPIVASNTGLNPEVVIENENGFLASNEQEWIDKLSLLIENPKLRKKLGENGRKKAVEKYSLRTAEQKFLRIITKVVQKELSTKEIG